MTLCFMGKYKELFSYLQTGEVNRKYIQEKIYNAGVEVWWPVNLLKP